MDANLLHQVDGALLGHALGDAVDSLGGLLLEEIHQRDAAGVEIHMGGIGHIGFIALDQAVDNRQNVALQVAQIVYVLGDDLPFHRFTAGNQAFAAAGLAGKARFLAGIIAHMVEILIDGVIQAGAKGVGRAVLDDLQAVDGGRDLGGQLLAQLLGGSLVKVTRIEIVRLFQLGQHLLFGFQRGIVGVGDALFLHGHELQHEVLVQEFQRLFIELVNGLLAQIGVRVLIQVEANAEEIRAVLRHDLLQQGAQLLHGLDGCGGAGFAIRFGGGKQISARGLQLGLIMVGEIGVFNARQLLRQLVQASLVIDVLLFAGLEQQILQVGDQLGRLGMGGVVGLLKLGGLDAELIEGSAHLIDARGVLGVAGGQHMGFQQAQHVVKVLAGFATVGLVLQQHGLGDLLANFNDGVQRGQRILEDHGDLIAAQLVHYVLGNAQQILAVV